MLFWHVKCGKVGNAFRSDFGRHATWYSVRRVKQTDDGPQSAREIPMDARSIALVLDFIALVLLSAALYARLDEFKRPRT